MLIDIYQSRTDREKYLAVRSGQDPSQMTFPATLPKAFHELLGPPRTEDFNQGDKRIGVNADQVLNDIAQQDFALFGAVIHVKIGGAD